MPTTVLLFTRDLRVHDNPALALAAAGGGPVVPLFVVDPALPVPAARRRFLAECLADLRGALRERGGDLLLRQGDPATEAVRLATSTGAVRVVLAGDASRYAHQRESALARACAAERIELRVVGAPTVVPPGDLRPAGGGSHYRVFTPYWRAWTTHPWRAQSPVPRRVPLPAALSGVDPVTVLGVGDGVGQGGETAARRRLTAWLKDIGGYPDRHDDLAADATSRLSAYLHFGCLSAVEVANRAAGCEAFVRQLCWRDFYHQVLADFPELPRRAYRRGATEKWRDDPHALAAWQAGQTGVPIVDAGMRQLAAHGWMHNRTRLITAAYLTKHLELDWRTGLDWYARLLVDADVANNAGNWQWVAGTGNDTRPYRRFNPVRQAYRFDPDGTYVRRWVPELAHLPASRIHEPWRFTAAGSPPWSRSAGPGSP